MSPTSDYLLASLQERAAGSSRGTQALRVISLQVWKGVEDTAEGWGEPLEGAVCPQGPKVWPCKEGGVDPVSVRAISGNWTSPMGFQEAKTWGSRRLPTLRGFMSWWGRSLGTGVCLGRGTCEIQDAAISLLGSRRGI